MTKTPLKIVSKVGCIRVQNNQLRDLIGCYITEMFDTSKRLLTDPVYIFIVCGYSSIMFIVGALTAFMPKFLEVVFYQTKANASFGFGEYIKKPKIAITQSFCSANL